MIRVLTILATIATLAVSTAPVASAGSSKKPPPRTAQVVVLIGANNYGLVAKPPPRGLGAANDISQFSLRTAVANHPEGTVSVMLAHGDFASATTNVKDGLSNTVMLGEGLVGQMERGKGGWVSPPKSLPIHENEGIDGGFKTKPNARNNGNGFTHTLEDAIIVSLKR